MSHIHTEASPDRSINVNVVPVGSRSRAEVREEVASRWSESRRRRRSSASSSSTAAAVSPAATAAVTPTATVTGFGGSTSGEHGASDFSFPQLDVCGTWRTIRAALAPSGPGITTGRSSDSTAAAAAAAAHHGRRQRRRASSSTRNRLSDSMLRLQSAAAVAAEVETMNGALGSNRNDDDDPAEVSEEHDHEQQYQQHQQKQNEQHTTNFDLASLLMPAGYDQSLALSLTSTTRTRAFHLLDLADVISSHRTFVALTAGPGVYSRNRSVGEMRSIVESRGRSSTSYSTSTACSSSARGGRSVYISPQFTVTKNRDVELLRLLVRLGVGLRCAGAEDVEAARAAVAMEETGGGDDTNNVSTGEETAADGDGRDRDRDRDQPIVDDAGRCRKPDGYYRRLLFPATTKERRSEDWADGSTAAASAAVAAATSAGSSTASVDLTVDGPTEIRRIARSVRRFASRASAEEAREEARTSDGPTAAAAAAATAAAATEPIESERRSSGSGSGRGRRFVLRLPALPGDGEAAAGQPPRRESSGGSDDDDDDGDDSSATAATVVGTAIATAVATTPVATSPWDDLIEGTMSAARDEGGNLGGVSVDLSPWSNRPTLLQRGGGGTNADGRERERDDNDERDNNGGGGGDDDEDSYLWTVCRHLRRVRILRLLHYHRRRCSSLDGSKEEEEEEEDLGGDGTTTPLRIDLTGLPYPLTRDLAGRLTGALAGIVSRPITEDELRSASASSATICGTSGKNGATTSLPDVSSARGGDDDDESPVLPPPPDGSSAVLYTADVSNHLVASAGALCARIIGVKRGDVDDEGEQRDGGRPNHGEGGSEQVGAAETASSSSSSPAAAVATHYYIDDGCYGSLGSSGAATLDDKAGGKEGCNKGSGACGIDGSASATTASRRGFLPLPLYGSGARSDGSSGSTTVSPPRMVRATVWGPTCDGLDRVCECVDLPNDLEANRDWLVFPHLGCGGFGGGLGLGTAFNGFDPPDTAYCVLGYFSGGSDGFGRRRNGSKQ